MRLIIAIAAVLIGLSIAWEVYRWGDCRTVGHSWTYCLLTIGK